MTFTFRICDTVTDYERQRSQRPRLEALDLAHGWKASPPTVVVRTDGWWLHIPFTKVNAKGTPVAPTPKWIPVGDEKHSGIRSEICIGVDQGVTTYVTIVVMYVRSSYLLSPTGRLERTILSIQELTHYYLGDLEALRVGFNGQTGRFNDVIPHPQPHKGHPWKKRPGSPTQGKGRLRSLRTQIASTQVQLNRLMVTSPQQYKSLPEYIRLHSVLTVH